MSAKNWCFTLNNPTDDESSHLRRFDDDNYRNDIGVTYLCYQREAGDSGTEHYQGYITFTTRKRLSQAKAALAERCHLEVAKGTPKQNRTYCTKEPRIDGPWEYGDIPQGSGNRTDLANLARLFKERKGYVPETELVELFPNETAKYPRFIDRLARLYSVPPDTPFFPRAGWQSGLSFILNGEPHKRKVYWYWEPTGNTGKSYFANNYRTPDGRLGYVVTGGRHSDIYYAYQNQKVVIFDWPRDSSDHFPYTVLEAFKNGYFLNTKYESVARRFHVPHIVIFCNFAPDQTKLSLDRWIIKQLDNT